MTLLADASVLITGGSGSFGNAAVKRLLEMPNGPRRVCILSRDEVKQSHMMRQYDDPRMRYFLGDVRDRARLEVAMRGVDVVFHAAALKRVEACAYNPTESISTNVLGSMNVAAAAESCSVGRVVALSTDKASAPSTTYGATKACMEAVFTSSTAYADRASQNSGTAFSVVRYGNVAGSRGSVIPLWREAIASGTPVKVFDPEATRFWFTLDGAVTLALWALEHMRGGELYVPTLPAFKVIDLAHAMGAEVEVYPEGLRPCEKRHEVMVSRDESSAFRILDAHFVRFLPGMEEGVALHDGFEFSSSNARQLSVDTLRTALEAL